MAVCSGCGKAVVWAHTEANGKRMPLDATPTDDGNVTLANVGGRLTARVHGAGAAAALGDLVPRYTPHFATCSSPPPKGPRQRVTQPDLEAPPTGPGLADVIPLAERRAAMGR